MKAIVYIGTSLDGFIAKKNDDIEWLTQFQNAEVGQEYEEFMKRIDVIVIGRGTFDKVLSFPSWPYSKKVFVLSTTIRQPPDALKKKVTIIAMKPKEVLTYLSGQGHSTVYIDGGKVIQDFLKEDCIDEMIITKVPLLVGDGIPLFGKQDKELSFRHLQTKILSNGLVKSFYERVRN